jgi:tryptophan-rich sensory protein
MSTVVEARRCARAGGWSSGWAGAVVFVAAPVLLSSIPGSVAFAVNPNTAADIGMTRVAVPPWVFVVAWAIIHAGMGLAAWRLRRSTDGAAHDACVPLTLLTAGYVQTNLFWLSDGLRSVAAADATGLLFATVTTWAFARQSRAAARWLVPWLVWMPVTLAIKIIALAGSP